MLYLVNFAEKLAAPACSPLHQIQPAVTDILNVYEETTAQGRKVWRHAATQPDDALHAQLFGWLAWKVLTADLKFC